MPEKYIMEIFAFVAILVTFSLSGCIFSDNKGEDVKINTFGYMNMADLNLWDSFEEWKEFECALCRDGIAYSTKTGRIECPNYPYDECGCEASLKLMFETTSILSCSISLNGKFVKEINATKKGNNTIMLGLSDGGRIDTKNTIKICCAGSCEEKTIKSLCG
ncbi:MAG: hypothetical protein GXO64_01655 [Candidatus Micrarchaeota archaeon]|nr:hypothetical protein [Candidatus Micrarchaeota archaeon]